MTQPRISIVTANFNGGRFIEATLKSVLDQGYPNLEYIVVDGDSEDDSLGIIERHAPRLAHFESGPDRGHGDALNKGFAHATGEIMAWINSDDMYLPWTLNCVADIFASHPDVDWIVGTNAWWNAKGFLTHSHNVYKNIHDYLRGDYAWIQQESVFWRRRLWDRAGGRISTDYRLMVDGELWTRFFLNAELVHVHTLLGGYRAHGENRAARHLDDCHAEMRRAIGVMRETIVEHRLSLPEDRYHAISWDYAQQSWRRMLSKK